jgi:hypothetical protein
MIIKRAHMDRRTVLRGIGAVLSLPLLEAMVPAARAADAAARPKRLLAFYSPNGMIMQNYTPAGAGKDFPLSPTLAPFARLKDRLTVVSNLAHLGDSDGHAQGCSGFLTGVSPRPTEGADLESGPSIDQIIANRYAGETLLPSLELGIDVPSALGSCVPNYSCTYTNTLSWRDAKTAVPVSVNPREVFERMFGDGDKLDADARLREQLRKSSILDFVRDDATRLSDRLGANDRRKLDQYLDAVRDVERRIQMASRFDPSEHAAGLDRPMGVPQEFGEHVKIMTDLQLLALQADITRVGTFMIGREVSNRTYPEIGVNDAHHMLSHHAHDPVKMAKLAEINKLHMQYFAAFLERLKETHDGAGSLLDSTLVLIGAGFGDSNDHDGKHLPMLVLGAGVPGNRHLVLTEHTPIANLHLTVLRHFDVPVEQWANSTGPLSSLLLS